MPAVPAGPDTLRGLALRTLFPGFDGTDTPPERLSRLIEAGLGGVVLFGRNIDPARGDTDDADLTREVAASLASRLRACGIDINFAPVADVDVDPRNPIVGVRAFGSDPHKVARHAAAFVTGQQSHGVIATVKHFPGHGGTADDSHVSLPVLEAPRELLDRRGVGPVPAPLA